MEIKNVSNRGALRNGNRMEGSVESALCSRMPYQPASVTIMELRVEQGIALSGSIDPIEPEPW